MLLLDYAVSPASRLKMLGVRAFFESAGPCALLVILVRTLGPLTDSRSGRSVSDSRVTASEFGRVHISVALSREAVGVCGNLTGAHAKPLDDMRFMRFGKRCLSSRRRPGPWQAVKSCQSVAILITIVINIIATIPLIFRAVALASTSACLGGSSERS